MIIGTGLVRLMLCLKQYLAIPLVKCNTVKVPETKLMYLRCYPGCTLMLFLQAAFIILGWLYQDAYLLWNSTWCLDGAVEGWVISSPLSIAISNLCDCNYFGAPLIQWLLYKIWYKTHAYHVLRLYIICI